MHALSRREFAKGVPSGRHPWQIQHLYQDTSVSRLHFNRFIGSTGLVLKSTLKKGVYVVIYSTHV